MFTRFYRDFRLASGRLAREEDVLGREVFPACRAGKLLNLLEGLSTTLEKAQTVQACFGQKQIVVAHLVPVKPASNSHLTIWSSDLQPFKLRRPPSLRDLGRDLGRSLSCFSAFLRFGNMSVREEVGYDLLPKAQGT